MALDNYRRVDIILDTANDKVDWQSPLNANTGEYNSRNLRVQLTNGGVVEPQTANLYFGFRHVETGESGVVPMNKVNSNRGIYEVYYPREMMAKEGVVICAVKIVDSTNGTNHINLTANFTVNVARSVINGNMEVPENSLKVFDKMVIDVMVHERRVAVIESTLNEIIKEYGDLKTWLEKNVVKQSQIEALTRQNAEIAFNAGKIDQLARTASAYDVFKNIYAIDEKIVSTNPKTVSLHNILRDGKTILASDLNKSTYTLDNHKILVIEGSGVLLGIRLSGNHYIRVDLRDEKNNGYYNLNEDRYWSKDKIYTKYYFPDELSMKIKADGKTILTSILGRTEGDLTAKISLTSLYLDYLIGRDGPYASSRLWYNSIGSKVLDRKETDIEGRVKGRLSEVELAGISFNNKLEIVFDAKSFRNIYLPIKTDTTPTGGNYYRTRLETDQYGQTIFPQLNSQYALDGLVVLLYPKPFIIS